MSGKWASSTRRARLPKDWPKRAARIVRRDGGVCQWPMEYPEDGKPAVCGKPYDSVDHVIPNDDHSDGNLRCLCKKHHDQKTQQEAAAGRSRRQTRSTTWPT